MKPLQETFRAIEFREETLILLDQRLLPDTVAYFTCTDARETEFAIREMVVRGAPAIGAAAAYGVYLAARESIAASGQYIDWEAFTSRCTLLQGARPTAVNLRWAVSRMFRVAEAGHLAGEGAAEILRQLLFAADAILAEDVAVNRTMAEFGADLIPAGARILTHCNTGALATGGWGTALGVIKEAHRLGRNIFVYADETRPRLQGSRLTAWELQQNGIPSRLIVDSAAAVLIRDQAVDLVILGADRIAANGDVCNKIGTFMLSVLCKEYRIPFYVAAPLSTIDFTIDSGADIPIEERSADEIVTIGDIRIAPQDMPVFNPAFDVTPHTNITAIITEHGILRSPFTESIAALRRTTNG